MMDSDQGVKISVITVVFNAAKSIRLAMESVLCQMCPSDQYIVIDGGSTDGTRQILEEYKDRLAYWVSEPDGGIYDAMNKGLRHARGNVIGILNADDTYFPGALQSVRQAFAKNPNAVLHGDIEVVDQGRVVDVWRGVNPVGVESQFRKMTINHPATFIPRRFYEKFGNYSLAYRLSSDYELVLRLIVGGVPFVYLDRPLTRFSVGGSSGGISTYRETLAIQRTYGRGYWDAQLWFSIAVLKMWLVKVLPASVLRRLRSR